MTDNAEVLIVGGSARLACRIRAIVPTARTVVRRNAGPKDIFVADYAMIPTAAFAGIKTVVNCVGTPTGDEATLWHVNVDTPFAAATRARTAGCRHFIQIGSLSVYGCAQRIDSVTSVAPQSAYGRSKAAADAALFALAGSGFAVTILRVPALYGVGATGKLGMLARAMRRFGGFIVPRQPVARSLLHLDNAAAVIARLIAEPEPRGGIVLAADHEPFNFASFAAAVAADSGQRMMLVRAPWGCATILRALAPNVHASLFADSFIVPDAAITRDMALPVALYDGIAAMLAAEPRNL